jgi:hypothetical protein
MKDDDVKRAKHPGARTLKEDEITAAPISDRRRMVFGMAVGLVGSAALAGCVIQPAPGGGGGGGPRTGRTDNDPTDQVNRGTVTGRSDNDPFDAMSRGSGRTGRTDNDPTDSINRGTQSGRTDSDTTDSVNRGRVHDNDPGDP